MTTTIHPGAQTATTPPDATTGIHLRLGIEAPQPDVHRMLATLDGLAAWWTTDTTGDPAPGGDLRFGFGPGRSTTMTVEEVTADLVAWRCAAGPDEWLGNRIAFELGHEAGETVVLFSHTGWREVVPFTGHCTMRWAMFLLGLKAGLEGGSFAPWPHEPHVSRWDQLD